jgi:hypothetical protein
MAIDQLKLNKEYIFTGRGTADELLGEFQQITKLEKEFKSWISLLRWSALAMFLVFLAAGLAVGAFLIVVGVLVGIGLLIYAAVVAAKGIIHDRVEFARLILKTLSQDAGRRGRFQVNLRLRARREKISEGPNPRGKGKQSFFRDAWLSIAGRLSDGTSLFESCTDLVRQRSKKNSRGKTKTKERKIFLLRLDLDYNPEKYGDATMAARHLEQPFRLPEAAQMKAFNTSDKALTMKTIVKGAPASAGLHAANEAMLLGAYRILNLARKRVIATGGAK